MGLLLRRSKSSKKTKQLAIHDYKEIEKMCLYIGMIRYPTKQVELNKLIDYLIKIYILPNVYLYVFIVTMLLRFYNWCIMIDLYHANVFKIS
jgi:hypothetical protein